MHQYLWTGKNQKGEKTKGRILAKGPGHVRIALHEKGIRVTGIKKESKSLSKILACFQAPVREKDLILFFRELSTMLNAGLPLLQSLEFLEAQHGTPGFQKLLESIKASVEAGESFTSALKNHPRIFKSLYIHMAMAGESAGILGIILERLAGYIEKMEAIKKKIKNAMLYPAFTLIVAGIVTALLLIFVIPVFEQMFADMGTTLPEATLIVLSMSDLTEKYFWHIVAGILILTLIVKWAYHTPKGRMTGDYLLLKMPVIGSLITKMAVAGFARTASSLLTSGVPVMEVLDIASGTSGNAVIQQAITEIKDGLVQGRYMAELIKETNLFPPMVSSMIAAGEATGTVDTMMEKIADFYDHQVDDALENLTKMMEPLMLIFLGIIIGALVISMYLPVFTMTGTLL